MYDITRPMHPGMAIWPGDPPFMLDWHSRLENGQTTNTAAIGLGLHCGTHLDAPYHVRAEGVTVADIALTSLIGPATLIEAADAAALRREMALLLSWPEGIPARVLVRTGAWKDPAVFPTDYPALHPDDARALARAGVLLFGTDAPSVDPFDSVELPAHHALLGAGTLILENLLLDGVPAGEHRLIALPLRISEADASPVRAILE